MKDSLVLGPVREQLTIVLASALAAGYGSFLLVGSSALATVGEDAGGDLGVVLDIVASVFVAIALYVSALVIAGCVATVLSGRIRHIATLRLLGASARDIRERIRREVALTAALGTLIGTLVGGTLAHLGRSLLVSRGTFPDLDYPIVSVWIVPMALAVVAVSAVAGWVGAARVLSVSPAAAMSGIDSPEPERARRLRAALAAALVLPGLALLVLAVRLGEEASQSGFACAFAGGALTMLGVITGAPFVVPRFVSGLGHLFGRSSASRIARRNAVADPMRTTRATLGLVLGVALVTTFASGTSALSAAMDTWGLEGDELESARRSMQMTSAVMIGLVVMASVIAAVGFVSTMSLVVIQRRREIGMLRAMGFTAQQVRSMVTRESLALGLTAVLLGIALGVLFGSVGAQSLMGGLTQGFVWGLPFGLLGVLVVCALALVLVAALPPARRAVRLTPVEALRVDA